MTVIFFYRYGLVYRWFIPRGQGIDRHVYLDILDHLHDAVRRRRPQVWRAGRWGVLHNGAPTHRANDMQNWFHQHRILQIPHPPYSLDLNPPDFWLFAWLKKQVCGELFPDVQQLENTLDNEIGQIPARDWASAMDRYVPRLRCCIQAGGDYFEHPWHSQEQVRHWSISCSSFSEISQLISSVQKVQLRRVWHIFSCQKTTFRNRFDTCLLAEMCVDLQGINTSKSINFHQFVPLQNMSVQN